MEFSNTISFHDSTIRKIESSEVTISIEIDDVFMNDEMKSVEVRFEGVQDLLEDGTPCRKLLMKMPDAEIVVLKTTKEQVELIVIWNDYQLRRSSTKMYRFSCRDIAIRILPLTT